MPTDLPSEAREPQTVAEARGDRAVITPDILDIQPAPVRTGPTARRSAADLAASLPPPIIHAMQIAEIRGITQTLDVLAFATATRETFMDGVQARDILAAPGLVRKGITAMRGADEIPAELADLDHEEMEVIEDALEDLLGPILDGIQRKIEQGRSRLSAQSGA